MNYTFGLDVSHWNGDVDWQYWWDQGYRFVYIKVSEGTGWEDWMWQEHANAARAVGFLVGPYHFFRSDYNGVAQGGWMYAVCGDYNWALPPVLDVESNPGNLGTAAYAARVRAALDEIRLLFDRKPVVYTSASKWKYTGNISVDAWLWAAHYTTASSPYIPSAWPAWTIWQYTSTPIDQNRFNGSYNDLLKWVDISPSPNGDLDERVGMLEQQMNMLEDDIVHINQWIRSYE